MEHTREISVQRSNSRVRVVSAHFVPNVIAAARGTLSALISAGTVTETRSREWKDGSYRFGADWLTPQARSLLGLVDAGVLGQPSLEQYEVPDREFGVLSLRSSVGFRPNDRNRRSGDDAMSVSVTIHRYGAVFTAIDVVLVWAEISLDSDADDVWTDLARAVRHRVSSGDDANYLRKFQDADGARLAFADVLLPVETLFIGDASRTGARSARNLFTFSRYKLLAERPEAVTRFLRVSSRKASDPRGWSTLDSDMAMSTRRLGEEASILDVAGLDALTVALWQLPTETQPAGAVAYQNVFHLGDLWLSFVVCIVQFQMLVSLEQKMLALVDTLERIGSMPRWSLRRIRNIFTVQSRYESVMRSFIQGYWRFGLVQVHSHDRRHRVYSRLREELSLDQSLALFREKLETLGSYVEEKQREFLNWLLVFVPFVSFLVGVFGINVKGWTSEEGMAPLTLLGMLVALTVLYAACVAVGRHLLGDRPRRRVD